jgi:putative ABC transport system substrate-binding protein
MRRRDFIQATIISAAWPLAARAQQTTMPVIGWLSSGTREIDERSRLPSFRLGLKEMGYTEDRNVAIEYRRAEDHVERLAALAADLAGRQVSLIVAAGRPDAALAAKPYQFRLSSRTRPIPCSWAWFQASAVPAGT